MATEKKLVRSKSGLRMISLNDTNGSPFTLTEPQWVPDNECGYCMQCQARFELLKRRHHCRRCGRCFCNTCCEAKVALPRMCFIDPVRQCGGCTAASKKENEFFDRHLKALLNGGCFIVTESDNPTENGPEYLCKLASDHRFLIFEGERAKRDPIMLQKLESLQVLTSGVDPEGNTIASGLAMKYKDESGDIQLLKMAVAPGPMKRQGQTWVAAMQKAFKMIYETRTSYMCENI